MSSPRKPGSMVEALAAKHKGPPIDVPHILRSASWYQTHTAIASLRSCFFSPPGIVFPGVDCIANKFTLAQFFFVSWGKWSQAAFHLRKWQQALSLAKWKCSSHFSGTQEWRNGGFLSSVMSVPPNHSKSWKRRPSFESTDAYGFRAPEFFEPPKVFNAENLFLGKQECDYGIFLGGTPTMRLCVLGELGEGIEGCSQKLWLWWDSGNTLMARLQLCDKRGTRRLIIAGFL